MVTPEADRMAEIVRDHAPLLKAAGFKKRRYCFNRAVGDGLVHVVLFWMGPSTSVQAGSFRLDFGVFVPEMTRSHVRKSDWINDYNCHLHRTVGQLIPGRHQDLWWRLDDPEASLLARGALERYGLPWLDQFPDHDAVLAAYESHGALAIGLTPAGDLDVADLYRALGRKADERRTLEAYVARPVLGSHARYLARYLDEHGHADLVPRIQTPD